MECHLLGLFVVMKHREVALAEYSFKEFLGVVLLFLLG